MVIHQQPTVYTADIPEEICEFLHNSGSAVYDDPGLGDYTVGYYVAEAEKMEPAERDDDELAVARKADAWFQSQGVSAGTTVIVIHGECPAVHKLKDPPSGEA